MLNIQASISGVVGIDPEDNTFQLNLKILNPDDRGAMFGLVDQQVSITLIEPTGPEPGYPKVLRGIYGDAIGQPNKKVLNHLEEASARQAGFTEEIN